MGLRDIEASLPPGFRFCPSDEELVCHYLYKKITDERHSKETLVEVDLHKCEPWELPDVAKLGGNEWYFFSFRERKYSTGLRNNRATTTGYWKATGKDRAVFDSTTKAMVGMRKTLVFYGGRAPNGIKTGWIMNEFRLDMPHLPCNKDWVLCRVFHRSQGGDQYPTKLSLEDEFDTNICASSSPPTDCQTMQGAYQQQFISFSQAPHCQETNPTALLQTTTTAFNPCFFQLPPECTVGGEEYGFLFDMDLPDYEPKETSYIFV